MHLKITVLLTYPVPSIAAKFRLKGQLSLKVTSVRAPKCALRAICDKLSLKRDVRRSREGVIRTIWDKLAVKRDMRRSGEGAYGDICEKLTVKNCDVRPSV